MNPFRASLALLLTAATIHTIWFQHIYQGIYYFALLVITLRLVPKFQLPRTALYSAWFLIWVDSLGTYYDLYGKFPWYDDFSHMAVSACVTLLVIALLEALNPNQSRGFLLIAGCTSAIALMAGYEILEYWFQHISGIRFIWGEFDTALDLQSDMLGALAGTFLLSLAHRLRK